MSIKPAHNSYAPAQQLMMYRVDLDQVIFSIHAQLDDTLPPMKIINPKLQSITVCVCVRACVRVCSIII